MAMRQCIQWTFALVTAMVLTTTLGSGLDVAAADDKPVQPVPDVEVVGDDVAPEFEPAELSDPTFDRYVSLDSIREGVVTGNAGLIIDAALQLHEGERILLRQRKGVSADQMLDQAVTVALQKGDKDSIARLGKAAEYLKKSELAKRVASVKDLVAASRSIDPRTQADPKLPAEGRFTFDGLFDQIDQAVTLNDAEALELISRAVSADASLDEKHKGLLQQGIKAAKEQIGDNAGVRSELMTRLAGSARGSARIDYKITNRTSETVTFSLHGSGATRTLAKGATGSFYATYQTPNVPYIKIRNRKMGTYQPGQVALGGEPVAFYTSKHGLSNGQFYIRYASTIVTPSTGFSFGK